MPIAWRNVGNLVVPELLNHFIHLMESYDTKTYNYKKTSFCGSASRLFVFFSAARRALLASFCQDERSGRNANFKCL